MEPTVIYEKLREYTIAASAVLAAAILLFGQQRLDLQWFLTGQKPKMEHQK